MLFTSGTFAFLFLPLVTLVYFAFTRASRLAAAWLAVASLFFYSYWAPVYVWLLLASAVFNYGTGVFIGRSRDRHADPAAWRPRSLLAVSVALNLLLLSYFKYADFFLGTLRSVTGADIPTLGIVLPIGISFFTFTQIAFLVDVYKSGVREYRFVHYLLFVTYFPHLVAGPVLHHAQMMPQFADASTYRVDPAKIAAGIVMFCIGLFKKIVIADGIAPYADAVFDAVAEGSRPTLYESWTGPLAYTFQLYFDFSGYSDMAVGLSMMLGITLPYNFSSPYRARNISDFWRRWHMTLSAFLRDYLYIPLGGNRLGPRRRFANLVTTMLLGGLWHGANWTFVAWGGLHGLYLSAHHLFGEKASRFLGIVLPRYAVNAIAWAFTMLAVVIAWVFFRAADFTAAGVIIAGMFGPHAESAVHSILWNAGLDPLRGIFLITACALVAVFPVNSNTIFEWHARSCSRSVAATWLSIGAAMTGAAAMIFVSVLRSGTSPFIYFSF